MSERVRTAAELALAAIRESRIARGRGKGDQEMTLETVITEGVVDYQDFEAILGNRFSERAARQIVHALNGYHLEPQGVELKIPKLRYVLVEIDSEK